MYVCMFVCLLVCIYLVSSFLEVLNVLHICCRNTIMTIINCIIDYRQLSSSNVIADLHTYECTYISVCMHTYAYVLLRAILTFNVCIYVFLHIPFIIL